MNRTEQPTESTPAVLIPPAEREICDTFLREHGDYENWSAETVQAYCDTIHHAASYGTA